MENPENEDTVTMPTRFGKTLFPRGPANMHEFCGDKRVSCWSEIDADEFQVRGKTYLQDKKKVKIPSKSAAFSLYRTDIAPVCTILKQIVKLSTVLRVGCSGLC